MSKAMPFSGHRAAPSAWQLCLATQPLLLPITGSSLMFHSNVTPSETGLSLLTVSEVTASITHSAASWPQECPPMPTHISPMSQPGLAQLHWAILSQMWGLAPPCPTYYYGTVEG